MLEIMLYLELQVVRAEQVAKLYGKPAEEIIGRLKKAEAESCGSSLPLSYETEIGILMTMKGIQLMTYEYQDYLSDLVVLNAFRSHYDSLRISHLLKKVRQLEEAQSSKDLGLFFNLSEKSNKMSPLNTFSRPLPHKMT